MKKLKLTINGKVNIFNLPENGEYKCEVEESYTPKVGDCVKVECSNTYVYYFKVKGVSNVMAKFSLSVGDNFKISKNGFIYINTKRIYTQITPEELKAKYAEAGYDWDYETDTIKPLKWIPKDGDAVWYLESFLKPVKYLFDEEDEFIQLILEKGLLFKSKEECQEFADHCMSYLNNKKE